MIIISDEVCAECGAFSAGNGYCSNIPGHPWVPRKMTPEEQAELAGTNEETQTVARKTFPTALFGECYAVASEMAPGIRRVDVRCSDDGGPIARLSIVPDDPSTLGEGEFLAKTYAENSMIASEVLAAGIFEDTGRRVTVGYTEGHVWRVVGGWQALGA